MKASIAAVALITTVAALMLAPADPAGAAKARWQRERVPVRDYTSGAWAGIVEEQLALVNAVMPPRAPRFVYERKEHRPCASLGVQHGAIVVCDSDTELLCGYDEVESGGTTCFRLAAKKHPAVAIRLSGWWAAGNPAWMRELVCHELMHATTWVVDAYGSHPDTSCVHGSLSAPGPHDAEIARKAYAKGKKRRHR